MNEKNFTQSNRGQSIVVGALLMIIIAILCSSMYLSTIVPILSGNSEFDTYQDVKTDMSELNSKLMEVNADGIVRSHTLDFSTSYPVGQISGSQTQSLSLTEADTVVEIDGSTEYIYNSGIITYSPNFNQLNTKEIFIERNTKVIDSDTQVTTPSDTQSLVNGNTISITEIEGNYNRSSANSVTTTITQEESISSYTVSNDIELEVYTQISEEKWNDLLESEKDENGGNITNIDYVENSGLNLLEISLQSDTYTIKTSKIKLS